ncbi:MAG: peptide chain release factor N(5)-glutamine methyltransferase, partial [Bacteroidales bacterium]|nr:peptide chain release factor N(5)-glutamine methyltransferase [Bacteroidales bacterium]
ENGLKLLKDKPEETIDSSFKALALKASGFSYSVEQSKHMEFPELKEEQFKQLENLIELRLQNTPLAHILNRQQFMGIEFISDSRALIPRKETEILGKTALEISNKISNSKNKVSIIDVCCGSGNLGISLAYHNPNANVFMSDLSHEAVDLANENILFLNLAQRVIAYQGDMFESFEHEKYYEKVDLVVCNPPYISSAKVTKMETEISEHEPKLAFDGGMMGFNIIQKVIREAPKFLISGGWLAF